MFSGETSRLSRMFAARRLRSWVFPVPGARDHEQRSVERVHGLDLLVVSERGDALVHGWLHIGGSSDFHALSLSSSARTYLQAICWA